MEETNTTNIIENSLIWETKSISLPLSIKEKSTGRHPSLISHRATRHSEAKANIQFKRRETGQSSNTFINPENFKRSCNHVTSYTKHKKHLRPVTNLIQTSIHNSIWSLWLTNKFPLERKFKLQVENNNSTSIVWCKWTLCCRYERKQNKW